MKIACKEVVQQYPNKKPQSRHVKALPEKQAQVLGGIVWLYVKEYNLFLIVSFSKFLVRNLFFNKIK